MPNYSLKARMLRIKQTIGFNFSTALSTSPSPYFHSATQRVFHEIPRAAGPTQQTTNNDGPPHPEADLQSAAGYHPAL